jgi:putative oxidoreductase
MSDLKLLVEPARSRVDVLTFWIPRLGVAILFGYVGASKFSASSMWVRLFAQIGFGQWLRYATGAMQVGGAILLLIPRTTTIGAALLACTMLGAVLVQLFVLHTGPMAIVPAALLAIVVAVGASRTL